MTLRSASDKPVEGEFKSTISELFRIFDPDTTKCMLFEKAESLVFKNPVVKEIVGEGEPRAFQTRVRLEFFRHSPGKFEIVILGGYGTWVSGAILPRAIEELHSICWKARIRK